MCSRVANPVSVIDLITPVTATHSGTCAIYLCHQPTSQLHTLVPDGREWEREAWGLRLIERTEWLRREGPCQQWTCWESQTGDSVAGVLDQMGQTERRTPRLIFFFFENKGCFVSLSRSDAQCYGSRWQVCFPRRSLCERLCCALKVFLNGNQIKGLLCLTQVRTRNMLTELFERKYSFWLSYFIHHQTASVMN